MSATCFLDSKAIPWSDDPGIPGFREKVLRFDEKDESVVRLWYLPPGWGADVFDGKPNRHYHNTVVERAFHLFGDFPHWEFSSVEDFDGELVILSKNLFMNRPVQSLHGLLPEPHSETGSMILYWSTGPGVSILDPKYDSETVKVPFDANAELPINKFTPCEFTQTDEVPWQPHPRIDGWKIRPLAEPMGDGGRVAMVHIPTDWQPSSELVLDGQPGREWLFVLSGDVQVDVSGGDGAGTQRLGEWGYLDWQQPASLVFPVRSASQAGCVALYCGEGSIGG
jgi:hypothetical protein